MAQIINSVTHLVKANTLFHEITSEEMELTVGGFNIIPLWRGNPDIVLSTFHDGINNPQTTYHGPLGLYDNKFFTVDFSRTTIYLVV